MAKNLWEFDHPYYCNQGNYFKNGCNSEFASWSDFLFDEGDADLDMNLVFRWDWEITGEDGEPAKPSEDRHYKDGTLLLFYMGQRKGLFRYCKVSVCQNDEPSVRVWLQTRFDHMKKLWEPLQ